MDADALKALNEYAGHEFEETYKKIAKDVAQQAKADGESESIVEEIENATPTEAADEQ